MTSRPRVTQLLEVDEKYLEKLKKQEMELRKLHASINKGRELAELESASTKVRGDIQAAEEHLAQARQKASDIVARAGEEAAKKLNQVEVDKALILAVGREERQKLLTQAEKVLESTRIGDEKQKSREANFSIKEEAFKRQLTEAAAIQQELANEKTRLTQLGDRLRFSQEEIARESAELSSKWTEIRKKEKDFEEIWGGIHQEKLDLEARSEQLKKREVQAKADMEVASTKMRQGQDRMNQAVSYEASLKTREIELAQAEGSIRVGTEDLRKRTSAIIEREKNCQIREAQIRARV